MAWDSSMTIMLRQVIGDITSPYTYTDAQLKTLLITNAQLIRTEITFDNSYTVNISSETITPDPTALSTPDDVFINFVVLKSAAILVSAEARVQSKIGISVQDGPSRIDIGGSATALSNRARDMLDAYERAKIAYIAGSSIGAKAILTPYTTSLYGSSIQSDYFV